MDVLRRALTALPALVLALGLLAAPAGADDGDNRHPSGKDRSVEPGASGTQGKSPSDPDGMTNGGMDKPGHTGGVDGDDRDGNNGCGNDDDFEDDNNGNCLGRQKKLDRQDQPQAQQRERRKQKHHKQTDEPEQQQAAVPPPPNPVPVSPEVAIKTQQATQDQVAPQLLTADRSETQVLGLTIERETQGAAAADAAAADTVVAQSATETTPAGGSLARTGLGVLLWAAIGSALVAIGILTRRAAARR